MSLRKDDLLSAFHDGEATSAERAVVEQRLSASAAARQELAEIREVSSLLKELPRESLPSEFPQQVLKAVEREMLIPSGRLPDGDAKRTQRAWSWWTKQSSSRRWAYGAGTVLTSAAGLFLLVRAMDGEPSTASKSPIQIAAADSRTGTSAEFVRNGGAISEGVTTETALPGDALGLMRSNRVDGALDSNSVTFNAPAAPAATVANRDGTVATSGGLYFDQSTLREAEIGDVVEALQTNGDQVAVVRLTVVDRQKGLKHLQVLLAKNHIAQSDAGDATKTFSDPRSERESADFAKRNLSKGTALEQILAVYVESDSQQLAATLRQLRESQLVQSLEVEQPILLAQFDPAGEGQVDAAGEGQVRLNENLSPSDKSAKEAAEKPSDAPRARKMEENKAKKVGEESPPEAQHRFVLKPESAAKKAEAEGDKQPAVLVKGGPTSDQIALGAKADVAQSADRKQMVSRQLALQLPADAVPAGTAGAKVQAQARGRNLTRAITRAIDAAEQKAESRPMQVLFVVVDQAQAGKSLQRNAAPKASTPAATPAEPAPKKTPEQDGAA